MLRERNGSLWWGVYDWAPSPCGHPYDPLRWSDIKLPLQMVLFASQWESFPTNEIPGFALRFKPYNF